MSGIKCLALSASILLCVPLSPVYAIADPVSEVDRLPDQPWVTTFAGSGKIGFQDGPAATASFVSPVDVSYADDGTLYVADQEAQRIRAISPTGDVRTIAGSGELTHLGLAVQGGYRDGPALLAQFDFPGSVLAMPNNTVLVADRRNFVLRLIAHGMVSTFAGRHGEFGSTDGDRTAALFRNPRSLARDDEGNVYVADWGNGVRRIDRDGRVTTLRFTDTANIVAIAIPRSNPDTLIAASSSQLEVFDLHTLVRKAIVSLDTGWSFEPGREGGRTIGPIAGIAAIDDARLVTVDPLNSAVRYVVIDSSAAKLSYLRALGLPPDENAANGSEGFADGDHGSAKFNQPTGIARSKSGELAIADLGNRRIRLIDKFDPRTHIDVDLGAKELPEVPDPSKYRIALVGNSNIWFDQAWHESVPGKLQDALNSSRTVDAKAFQVFPIMRYGLTPLASLDLIDETFSSGAVDTVVLDLTTYGQIISEGDANSAFAPGFDTKLRDELKIVDGHLRQANVTFLVVVAPGPADFPDEFVYRRLEKGSPEFGGDTSPYRDAGQVQQMHDVIESAVTQSGVHSLDLWPRFLRAYASTDRKPLFRSWDHHMSAAGRNLIVEAIANRLRSVKTQR